jgi:hypothetical protein
MKPITIAVALVFLVGAFYKVGAYHDVRWTPGKWCGAHPPYTGTLWIGATYGLPFPWLELGTYEKCTTAPSWPTIQVYPAPLMLNLVIFGVVVYLIEKWGILSRSESNPIL